MVDDDTWPEDLWDATVEPLGLDDVYGDAHRLVVYAGHGLPGELQWGRPSDNGECRLETRKHARLGRLSGDTAAAVMLLTSCTLLTTGNELWRNFEPNAARQIFGFHDSPHIGGREPRDVFKRTQDGQSTKDAWLDEMDRNLVPGRNSPVVLTMGVTGVDAMEMHGVTNLASGAGFLDNVGEPADAFFFEWLNNGCTRDCGGCSSLAPEDLSESELQAGAELPIVEITRPQRSARELVARSSALVSLMQGRPVEVERRAQLERWANRVVRDVDVTVMTLPGEPRIQIAYDPSTDRLVIDHLDARDVARPRPSEAPAPERHRVFLEVAQGVRDDTLAVLDGHELDWLGVPRGSTFSLSTREAGVIVSGIGSGSVPFEILFSTFGNFAGHPVFDTELEIGVTRYGELSRLGISGMQVTKIGAVALHRTPAAALERLEQEVAANDPRMLRMEVETARVGFVSPGGPSRSALIAPELAVDYIILHTSDGARPVVSRRYSSRVSLVSDSVPHPRLEPDGAVDDPGDSRR
ncbi:DUF6345 domain-containing protein [Paraliomyxa miuraensis]|uniref:DUF6345 domain-containing protein n=1 Tax=Paraliomyxa miuraensis TaxID=376150 RepID=UPI00225A5DDA|nr:DUF6345 domain-containing protein [Paraliomyxa miuraensis]MCX4247414.1 DUF6345 domain-containing protein [Paraliomyxa miuraensis]